MTKLNTENATDGGATEMGENQLNENILIVFFKSTRTHSQIFWFIYSLLQGSTLFPKDETPPWWCITVSLGPLPSSTWKLEIPQSMKPSKNLTIFSTVVQPLLEHVRSVAVTWWCVSWWAVMLLTKCSNVTVKAYLCSGSETLQLKYQS